MAAKKKEPVKEGKESPPLQEPVEPKDQPKKGFMSGKLKKVAFPLIVVILSYVVVTKVISPKLLAEKKELEKKKKLELKGEEEKPKDKSPDKMIGQVYTISDIIVNPAGSNGERFVKTSIALEIEGAKLTEELTKRDVQLRDILIGIFTSKTIGELTNPARREDLRREVKEKINSLLVSGKIKNVYFTDLVIQ